MLISGSLNLPSNITISAPSTASVSSPLQGVILSGGTPDIDVISNIVKAALTGLTLTGNRGVAETVSIMTGR